MMYEVVLELGVYKPAASMFRGQVVTCLSVPVEVYIHRDVGGTQPEQASVAACTEVSTRLPGLGRQTSRIIGIILMLMCANPGTCVTTILVFAVTTSLTLMC